MLLVETLECASCKFFEEGYDLAGCTNPNVLDLVPGGTFNYYYDDIANCTCKCGYSDDEMVAPDPNAKYEVLTYSEADGWENTWTTWSDENPEDVPETFLSKEDAELAIRQQIESTADAIKKGDIDPDSALTRENFQIRKVEAKGI